MTCDVVTLPGGGRAIICSGRGRSKARCACGRPGTLLCDWKMGEARKTCDAPICALCATSPAPDKDLCPAHAKAFKAWQARHAAPIAGTNAS
tara:strand:- start:936 stop:1211 length:276 start_codon:yes stop_codon:yes gene_type:complete